MGGQPSASPGRGVRRPTGPKGRRNTACTKPRASPSANPSRGPRTGTGKCRAALLGRGSGLNPASRAEPRPPTPRGVGALKAGFSRLRGVQVSGSTFARSSLQKGAPLLFHWRNLPSAAREPPSPLPSALPTWPAPRRGACRLELQRSQEEAGNARSAPPQSSAPAFVRLSLIRVSLRATSPDSSVGRASDF